jgi:hypothetical protein
MMEPSFTGSSADNGRDFLGKKQATGQLLKAQRMN